MTLARLTPECWSVAEAILHRALSLPNDRRERFLSKACRGDEELRAFVERLLEDEDEEELLPISSSEPPTRPGSLGPESDARTRLRPGDRIGRAAVLGPLARGGFGEVYLAEDELIGRRVALKVVSASGDEAAREAVLAEAQSIGALEHPNVVSLHALHPPTSEFPAWAFELSYVEGGSLQDLLDREGPLEEERALELAEGMAAGLARAHRSRLVHGDIKPANVLLTPEGRPQLADFGLARLLLGAGDTLDRDRAGTPNYMPPERVRGEPGTEASDVWSFGVTLHRMLAGRLPFEAEDLAELWDQVTGSPPRELPERVSPGTRAFLRKCLAKRPHRRWRDGTALLDAVRRLRAPLRPEAASARRPTTRPPLGTDEPAAILRTAFEELAEGRASFTWIVGEPGVGKTHLVEWCRRQLADEPDTWLDVELRQGTGWLRPLARELAARAPSRASTPGASEPADPVSAVLQRLRELSTSGRVVLHLHGLSHADERDWMALGRFVEATDDRAVAWLVERVDEPPEKLRLPAAREAALTPLSPADSVALLQEQSGGWHVDGSIARAAWKLAAGNPRATLDLVRHLEAVGAVERTSRGLEEGRRWGRVSLPEDQSDMLAARLARLPDADRQLLDLAVVAGSGLDSGLLAPIVGEAPLEVDFRLQRLQRQGFLRPLEQGHAFADEGARRELEARIAPADYRARLHAALAERLEDGGEGVDPGRLGRHWEEAGRLDRARPHLAAALLAAERRQELLRAEEFGRRAGLLEPEAPLTRELAGAALALASCLAQLSREEARPLFERVRALAEESGDEQLLLRTACRRARVFYQKEGLTEEAAALLERAAAALPSSSERGLAQYCLGALATSSGRPTQALRRLRRALREFRLAGNTGEAASALNVLGHVAAQLGRTRRARKLYGLSARVSREAGRRANAVTSEVNECIAAFDAGELEGLAEQLAACTRVMSLEGIPIAPTCLVRSQVQMAEGRLQDAESSVRQALEASEDPKTLALARILLAELACLLGRAEEADEALATAERLLEGVGTLYLKSTLALTRAFVENWTGRSTEAARSLRGVLSDPDVRKHSKLWEAAAMTAGQLVLHGADASLLSDCEPLDDLSASLRSYLRAVDPRAEAGERLAACRRFSEEPSVDRREILRAEIELVRESLAGAAGGARAASVGGLPKAWVERIRAALAAR